jgi:squalene-hopene/tetraprenyl-beta-curcumene cyclase
MSLNLMATGDILIKLQPILATIQNKLDALSMKWSDKIFTGTNQRKLTAFDFYPFLFWDAFPSIGVEDIKSLSVAGSLLVQSNLLYDRVLDRTNPKYLGAVSALRLQAMQIETYNSLHQLFPASTSFWQYFNTYFREYIDASLEEQCFASGEYPWSDYTEERILDIIRRKNGIARIAIAGMVELSGDDSLLEPLTRSIHSFNIANQIWDDLCDWKEDLTHQVPSLVLSRLLTQWIPTNNPQELVEIQQQIARSLYYEGHAQYILELAVTELDRAHNYTADLKVPAWHSGIENLRNRCQEFLKSLQKTVRRNLTRVRQQPDFSVELPPATTQWQKVSWSALNFIIHQWKLGFGEAQHIMYFPEDEGFNTTEEYHSNDIFQRALIADTLCDANLLLDGKLQPLLDYEVQYLIDSRLSSGVGGWSYFPSIPEVAADADDLGQVMQVLLRSGHSSKVIEHCELPLSVLLRDRTRSDGSIETWIIPATELTPQQQRQIQSNETKWGTGPDNEVMANILYALHMYHRDRFLDTILFGIKYLETQQETDGSWTSKWYYGQYYGTYVCLRLLMAAKPDSLTISSAVNFLRSTQHPDGGWGMSDESDALSTALALLGLAVVQSDLVNPQDLARAELALSYLENQPEWSSINFIRPRASAPYGSKTITTMYVLKSTLAWHQLVKNLTTDNLKVLSLASFA